LLEVYSKQLSLAIDPALTFCSPVNGSLILLAKSYLIPLEGTK
jgi:hypothetical protein